MKRCTCELTGKREVTSIGVKLVSTERAVTTLTTYFAAGPGVLEGVTVVGEESWPADVSRASFLLWAKLAKSAASRPTTTMIAALATRRRVELTSRRGVCGLSVLCAIAGG
jgi:hypothetical protein